MILIPRTAFAPEPGVRRLAGRLGRVSQLVGPGPAAPWNAM